MAAAETGDKLEPRPRHRVSTAPDTTYPPAHPSSAGRAQRRRTDNALSCAHTDPTDWLSARISGRELGGLTRADAFRRRRTARIHWYCEGLHPVRSASLGARRRSRAAYEMRRPRRRSSAGELRMGWDGARTHASCAALACTASRARRVGCARVDPVPASRISSKRRRHRLRCRVRTSPVPYIAHSAAIVSEAFLRSQVRRSRGNRAGDQAVASCAWPPVRSVVLLLHRTRRVPHRLPPPSRLRQETQ